MTTLWDDASYDAEAEDLDRKLTGAREAATETTAFLFAASSKGDYENRKALMSDQLDKAAAKVTLHDPVGFAVVRSNLESSLDQDFFILAKEKAASRKTAEKCGYCGGSGTVANGSPGMDLGPGFPAYLDCPRCKGTGEGNSKLKPYFLSSKKTAAGVAGNGVSDTYEMAVAAAGKGHDFKVDLYDAGPGSMPLGGGLGFRSATCVNCGAKIEMQSVPSGGWYATYPSFDDPSVTASKKATSLRDRVVAENQRRASLRKRAGERRMLTLPYSEVCMYMKIAGTTMEGELVQGDDQFGMVQLYNEDGSVFSFPITAGEAGWGRVGSDHTLTDFDEAGQWYPKSASLRKRAGRSPSDKTRVHQDPWNGDRWQAQYFDADDQVWYDIGEGKHFREEAEAYLIPEGPDAGPDPDRGEWWASKRASLRKRASQEVTVLGPNLPSPWVKKGDFQVHRAGCADIAKIERYVEPGWTFSADSKEDVIYNIFSDIMGDYPEGDKYNSWEPYEGDAYFAPCVSLPRTASLRKRASRKTAASAWFECDTCGNSYERFTEDDTETFVCPNCGGTLRGPWQVGHRLHEVASRKTGQFRADVTGIGENRWSNNAMVYDTEEEAKAWLDGLSMRWFGYDMARVVSADTPSKETVDPGDPAIYQNFRSGSRKTAEGPTRSWPCVDCGTTIERYRGMDDVQCPKCGAPYNSFGQRLRDDYAGNPSAYDEDISDLEGYEIQHAHDSSKRITGSRRAASVNPFGPKTSSFRVKHDFTKSQPAVDWANSDYGRQYGPNNEGFVLEADSVDDAKAKLKSEFNLNPFYVTIEAEASRKTATSSETLEHIMSRDPNGGERMPTEEDYARFESWIRATYGDQALRDYRGWGKSEDLMESDDEFGTTSKKGSKRTAKKVEVYLNEETDPDGRPTGMLKGYRLGDALRLAIGYEAEGDDLDIAEEAFYEFNVGEGPLAQEYRAGRNRSLSVGDVVKVDGVPYAVDMMGYKKLLGSKRTAGPVEGAGAIGVVWDTDGVKWYIGEDNELVKTIEEAQGFGFFDSAEQWAYGIGARMFGAENLGPLGGAGGNGTWNHYAENPYLYRTSSKLKNGKRA